MTVVLSRKGGGGTGGTGTAQALSIGVSTGGNTSGNTTVNSGSRFVIVGSNGITASQGTAAGATTVTLSGITQSVQTQGVVSMGVSTGGNTSGNTTVNTGSRFVLAGGNNITLSQATAAGATTITISGGAAGANGTLSNWPPQVQQTVTTAMTAAHFATAATRTTMTAGVFPIGMEEYLSANVMRHLASVSMTSSASNSHWAFTLGQSLGIYTLTGNTLSVVSTFSNDYRFTYSSAANSTNASATWQMSCGSGAALSGSRSLSTNNAGASGYWTIISAIKWHYFASDSFSMSPGQYFGAYAFSSSSSGANLASLSGLVIPPAQTGVSFLEIGRTGGSFSAPFPLGGLVSMTQTNTAMPDSILTADISVLTNNATLLHRSLFLNMVTQFTS